MAAKVVMVAVPTVLGIASIRVHGDSEAPVDELITREKLSIYNPLPQSPQFQFVAEKPGTLQSGFTNLRETLLPYVWALQDACVSVKKGSINLYHVGEDAYHYLKDPPPGFLPRVSTITLAGLLGVFLARKGSRLRRLALPLGMMSAGVSVCYPAQTVAVLKVTGKKMYAAGQWSGTTVSSLFTSKSKEQVSNELVSPQPEPATLPKPDSPVAEEVPLAPCHAPEPTSTSDGPAQTAPTLESETVVDSLQSESAPAGEEPPSPVDSKDPAEIKQDSLQSESAPAAEEPPSPVDSEDPAEMKQDSLQSESAPAAEELPSPVDSEDLAEMKQTSEVTSAESSPVETIPTSATEADVQSAPAEFTPASKEPSAPEPLELTPEAVVEPTPAESVPAPEQLPAPVESEEPLAPAQELTDSTAAANEAPTPVVEEASALTHTPPLPQQAETETSTGVSGFNADPALVDYGQSNPEDEDLYSTRS
ncbi:MICOS complex subunit MIC27 [Lampris incognitus]|uniref:MICOS complex subunit MIC27 n=1 Tax=Lampris incognitus TaxID=2546036 RepID=UPI0024B50293|nr:MICOS complex subunit MIC27 [Lampris incognitus]